MNKFRLLRADEIECRVSSCNDKGVSLLLYKTARTDANLLDETVGSENWENDFKVVDGVLYGGIGIYDQTMDRWVWKWDAGTESNTEAEKGRASDAFKRAGFKHGIGRELYTSPFIWIPAANCEITERNGRKTCYDRFRVVEIGYNDKNEVNRLLICNDSKGVDVFTFPKNYQKEPEPQPVEAPDGYYYCQSCGKPLTSVTLASGKLLDHKEVARRTLKKYGKQLCQSCIKYESQTA